MSAPAFAVVGHANKGKSSVVATLAEDVRVAIDRMPGTTLKCQTFPMKVDDRVLYVLIDTPGFEQALAALDWMRRHETDAASRGAVVRRFVELHREDGSFPEECELLQPILDGASVLYVVDGSRPYSPDYDAEMEILRWTGQPRMALINRIGEQDHVSTWRAALDQYFSLVRTFNAHQVDFDARMELLRTIRDLRDDWQSNLDEAITVLREDREHKFEAAADAIAAMLCSMVTLRKTHKLPPDADMKRTETAKEKLETTYKDALRKLEQRTRRDIEAIFGHVGIERQEGLMPEVEGDLFTQETWTALGLTGRQLMMAGAAGGAMVGGAADLMVGGTSFLMGTLIGTAVGTVSGWYSANKLPKVKLAGLPMGGQQLRIGPMASVQFPWIVLDRALLHADLVMRRAHARRDQLLIPEASATISRVQQLDAPTRKRIEQVFTQLRRLSDAADTGTQRQSLSEALLDPLHSPQNPSG